MTTIERYEYEIGIYESTLKALAEAIIGGAFIHMGKAKSGGFLVRVSKVTDTEEVRHQMSAPSLLDAMARVAGVSK